jgi:hypothetical protein
MILSEEDGAQIPKLRTSYLAAGVPTVRLPERVAGRSSSLSIILPDYETSEAQHKLINQHHAQQEQQKSTSRFWKATVYAMVIYVILSICVTVLLVVSPFRPSFLKDTVSIFRKEKPTRLRSTSSTSVGGFAASRWRSSPCAFCLRPTSNRPRRLPTMVPSRKIRRTLHIEASYPSHPSGCTCHQHCAYARCTYLDYSASQTFLPSDSITIRSNVSDDRSIPQQVLGNLTIDINPDKSITTATISLNLSTSTLSLQSATYACLNAHDNVTLFLYVGYCDQNHPSLSKLAPLDTISRPVSGSSNS